MRYLVVNSDIVEQYGFTKGRMSKGGNVILNEKEVMFCSELSGDLETRASEIDGKIHSNEDAKKIIREEGYKYE